MKYTPQQYEVAKKFREFYYVPYEAGVDWEGLSEYRKNEWFEAYLNPAHKDFQSNPTVRKQTEEFFAAKEKEIVVTPSSYTFVSTNEDVDLLRIIREAPAGSPFILIEKKNRNTNKTDTFLLVHEKVLNSPTLSNLKLYGKRVNSDWGVCSLGHFPGKNLEGTGYQGHFVQGDRFVSNLRTEIEVVIEALNPKDTKTTVTVW